MYTPRPLSELLSTDDPAWPLVQEWVADATNPVDVLPPSPDAGTVLKSIQVTLRAPLGAIAYHTGGILVDDGWIRILGSGHPRLPRTLLDWNLGRSITAFGERPEFFLIADDVIGGFFAINGGAFGSGPNHVFYHAPDTLRWESLEQGYSDFLAFCFLGDLEKYYEPYRWPEWRDEVARIGGGASLSVWPPLWTKEGKDIQRSDRRAIPVEEVYGLNVIEYPRQLGD